MREPEVLLSQRQTIAQACKSIELSEQTYYRWRREYGGMEYVVVPYNWTLFERFLGGCHHRLNM